MTPALNAPLDTAAVEDDAVPLAWGPELGSEALGKLPARVALCDGDVGVTSALQSWLV